jgi:hypothetical protein
VKINWNHKPGPVDRLFSTNACSVETEDFLAAGILRKKTNPAIDCAALASNRIHLCTQCIKINQYCHYRGIIDLLNAGARYATPHFPQSSRRQTPPPDFPLHVSPWKRSTKPPQWRHEAPLTLLPPSRPSDDTQRESDPGSACSLTFTGNNLWLKKN